MAAIGDMPDHQRRRELELIAEQNREAARLGPTVRLETNLIPGAVSGLADLEGLGERKVDAVNQALIAWSWIRARIDEGCKLAMVLPDGTVNEVDLTIPVDDS